MATQVKDEQSQQPLNITMADLQNMLSVLVAEMKKPVVDEDLLKRNATAKERLRQQRLESEADRKAIEDSCSHLREDNTARIAWAENFHRARGLYVREGFCQMCNKHFHPNMADPAQYVAALRMPTGKAGILG